MNRTRQVAVTALAAITFLNCERAAAQGARISSAVEFAREAGRLKPGQWVWAPQIAPQGPVMVIVDLSKQLATVYRNGVRIGVSTASTGKAGHATPTGVFTILQKNTVHRSSTYNNASMPFQQRLTWDGVALHAGGLPGYPESHGCVHLPYTFAKLLFGITASSTTVIIAGNAQHPVETYKGDVLAPMMGTPTLEEFWSPERSPSGPVTIVMSRSDGVVAVMRNGVEIGRASAINSSTDNSTHVLTLSSYDDGKPTWIYAGTAGHQDEEGRVVDEFAINQVRIAPSFKEKLATVLTPGATLLVTQAPLAAGAPGAPISVIKDIP